MINESANCRPPKPVARIRLPHRTHLETWHTATILAAGELGMLMRGLSGGDRVAVGQIRRRLSELARWLGHLMEESGPAGPQVHRRNR
jgi:hypothetical protein